MKIVMEGSGVFIGDLPGVPDGKLMQFQDLKSGIIVEVPLSGEDAKKIAGGLQTKLVIAGGPLPPLNFIRPNNA